MRLTVVGPAPAYTLRAGRASSCYLVEDGDSALVLDMGQGSFSELARYRRPETVDAILISHLHADHLVDLVPLRHYLSFEVGGGRRTGLWAPGDLRRRFDAFQGEEGFLRVLQGEPLHEREFDAAGFRVHARRVTHIPDSFAFRVWVPGTDAGLVYSGDCGRWQDLLPLIRSGDTLLCEAALGTGRAGGGMHLTAAEAARPAAERGARRLVLTHVLDRWAGEDVRAAAAEVFDGEVLLADPGLRVDV